MKHHMLLLMLVVLGNWEHKRLPVSSVYPIIWLFVLVVVVAVGLFLTPFSRTHMLSGCATE